VKKILLVAVALVLGLSGAAFAIQAEIPADTTAAIAKGGTQVTIGGELRFRGSSYQNISDFKSVASGTTNGTADGGPMGAAERDVFETRVRLSVEAKMSPNTIGFIQLEGAGAAGTTGENTNWGATATGSNNAYGSYDRGEDKSSAMQIMQAWIQHSGSGLFGVPAYVKVGHMPITIGAGIFYNHNVYGDDGIIAGITPIKGLDLSAIYVKLAEGLQKSSDDMDLYSVVVSYAINKDISIGADASLLEAKNGSLWGGAGTTAGLWSRLYNFGVNAKGAVQGFKFKGTLDFQTGRDNVYPHWKYTGWAGTLGGSYTFAPVTLGLNVGYGSGDDKSDTKVSTFQTAQGHNKAQPGTFIYEYLTRNAAGNLSGGLQNTIYGQLTASATFLKDFNVGSSITVLKAARKNYGGGTPLDNGGAHAVASAYIGTEIDFNASYQIDKGLKYFVEGGYLFAGNFWKTAVGSVASPVKVNDPWGIRHGLQLNF